MEIAERRQGGALILRPTGRIDRLEAAAFQKRLLEAMEQDVDCVVDFSNVELISSAGLRAFIMARRAIRANRVLAVACLTGVVREIFRISNFSHLVPIFATVEEAIAAGRQPLPQPAAALRPVPEAAGPRLGVRFWGTRGSLPAPVDAREIRAKLRAALLAAKGRVLDTPTAIEEFIDKTLPFSVRGTFGGNTSCVQIVGGEEYVLCDLGSGVREFGHHVLRERGAGQPQRYNVFQSHMHWDHIMGFPFFAPAYIPGNVIRIHGCHDRLKEAFERQQSDPCFPVDFHQLRATIEFVLLEPGHTVEVAGFSVTPIKQNHAGDSYGYRFARLGKTIVYSTDCEHKFATLEDNYPFIAFYRNADLLIFDAMYSLADMISVKEDWGHSSNVIAVELAQAAGVRRLVLFHHEPAYDDGKIEDVFHDTVRFEEIHRHDQAVEVIAAYDGLELTI
jgi:anti-anti-sigma factor